MLTSLLFLAATAATASPICDPATAIATELSNIEIEQLEATLSENRECSGGQFLKGRISLREGNIQAAIDHLEFARRLSPGRSSFIRTLGDAYIARAQEESSLGDAKRGKELYEKAVAADPENIEARASLAGYLRGAPWIAGGGVDDALEQAEAIARLDPVRGAMEIAATFAADDEPELEWQTLEQAFAEHSDSVFLALRFAVAAQQRQLFDRAHDILAPFVAAENPDPVALYQHGRTSALSGRFVEEGRKSMQRYIEFALDEEDPVVPLAPAYWRLGMIEARVGNVEAARKAYEAGMKYDAEYEPLQDSLEELPAVPVE